MIFLIIGVSSINLCATTYLENDNVVMEYLDLIINLIFMGEMVMKIITYGLVFDESAYLKDNWNQLDFIIVLFSLLDMSLTNYNLSFIKIIRLLRILRPLRFISRNPSMKLLVISLFESIKEIANVVVVIFFIWTVFAIILMNSLSYISGFCNGTPSYYGINKADCLLLS
jgi:hypothetical protein